MKLPKAVSAYAWECDFGLCRWAQPDAQRLATDGKPSPEAKIVPVRIVKLSDWRKIAAKLKELP